MTNVQCKDNIAPKWKPKENIKLDLQDDEVHDCKVCLTLIQNEIQE
jgi:hypothetical protein